MYEKLLSLTYKECREMFPEYESISNSRKVVALVNNGNLDSYAKNSDIVIYYDIVTDSSPLVLVERLDSISHKFVDVKKVLDKESKSIKGYSVTVSKSSDNRFIDVVLTMRNIYEALSV